MEFHGRGIIRHGLSKSKIGYSRKKSRRQNDKRPCSAAGMDQNDSKGEHAKSKARINSYESLLEQQSENRIKDLEIYIPPGPRLGNLVIEADKVAKSYGDNILVEGMTFSLPRGGIVGIIGPERRRKTTLFRMITGQEKPDSGNDSSRGVDCSHSVDQSRELLAPNKTIWEIISGGRDIIRLGSREVNSRAYVARFNFSGADQQKLVGALSGGERNRVHLACMLKEGANVLLLGRTHKRSPT